MPEDLDIDRTKDLFGTMASYNDHLLISTGQADWKSKIEDERDTAPWGKLTAHFKEMLGPKGQFRSPDRNVVVSTSSFSTEASTSGHAQALLFPSFLAINEVDATSDGAAALLRAHVTREEEEVGKSKAQDTLRGGIGNRSDAAAFVGHARPIAAPTILICSHNSRDARCGVLGPLLHAEFVQYINKRATLRNKVVASDLRYESQGQTLPRSIAVHSEFEPDLLTGKSHELHPINVGMISHIGGHKWAGNVIIYIPPNYQISKDKGEVDVERKSAETTGQASSSVHETLTSISSAHSPSLSPLAGKGIWYGRVEPRHVEGIVERTIGQGQVIRDLFRGGIHQDGSPIWI